MSDLRISRGLSLPLDFVTKTCGILAMRRKGKTYSASVIAEELVAAKAPFVVLDPTGAWWGLRASADGKRAGLPVVIFGGQHGDLPLERTAGKFVADLVVEEPNFYVIDFSLFESGEAERQFAADFAERLYRRKGKSKADFPLHLFVDEADRFMPQKPPAGDQRMLGAFEAIVRRGGLRGLGTTLITQRSAVINKNVLEQADMLIVLRVVGPNDRAAIDRYVSAYGTDEERAELMGSLSTLALGEAWVWEPGADPPLFERVHIRKRKTFNSSATPESGKRRVVPRVLAAVDKKAIEQRMAETIERVKADDPKELKKALAVAQREVSGKQKDIEKAMNLLLERDAEIASLRNQKAERIEVPVLSDEDKEALTDFLDLWAGVSKDLDNIMEMLAPLGEVAEAVRSLLKEAETRVAVPSVDGFAITHEVPVHDSDPHLDHRGQDRRLRTYQDFTGFGKKVQESIKENGDVKLIRADRRILAALAQFPDGRTKNQVALLTGYSGKSGGFNNSLAKLRSRGFIDGRGTLHITEEGLKMLGDDWEPLPTGPALIDHWDQRLPKAERTILRFLAEAHPRAFPKESLAMNVGYSAGSGGFNNALSKLRTLELITRGGDIELHPDLIAMAKR